MAEAASARVGPVRVAPPASPVVASSTGDELATTPVPQPPPRRIADPEPRSAPPVRVASPDQRPVRYGDVPTGPLPSYVGRVARDTQCRTIFGTGPRYDESARCTGGQGAQIFTIPEFWTPADPPTVVTTQ
jgi:hypothetical protein